MNSGTPAVAVRAIDYALGLLFKNEGPMPEPDVDRAEQALSLIAGLAAARTEGLQDGFIRDLKALRRSLIDGDAPSPN